jgi:hypothetical protein
MIEQESMVDVGAARIDHIYRLTLYANVASSADNFSLLSAPQALCKVRVSPLLLKKSAGRAGTCRNAGLWMAGIWGPKSVDH